MKTTITKITALSVFAMSAMLFSACSEDASNPASNEVPLEESLLLEGIAATGYAASARTFYVNNNAGELVFKGVTNEAGEYQFFFGIEKAKWPMDVVVELDDSKIKAIVPYQSDTIKNMFALVNPITNLFAEKAEEEFDRKEMTRLNLDLLNQESIQKLLGEGIINADVFVRDESFKAAQKNNHSAESSLEDMVLHTMGEIAERHQEELQTFIVEEHDFRSHLFENDEEFYMYLAVNLVDYNVACEKIIQSCKNLYWDDAIMADSCDMKINERKNRYKATLAEIPECNQEKGKAFVKEMLFLREKMRIYNMINNKTASDSLKNRPVDESLQMMEQLMVQLQADPNCEESILKNVEYPNIPREQQGKLE
jgi:hypothetical protein